MNREIKFRCWYGEKMGIVRGIDFDRKKVQIFDGYTFQWIRFEDIKLMQYTGLKDKNGKEIYEGDIIKFQGYIGKVGYVDNRFLVLGYREGEGVEDEWIEDVLWWNVGKVVGNIYENPNLLSYTKE